MNRLEEMQNMKAIKARRKILFSEKFSQRLEYWKEKNHKKEKEFVSLVGVSKNVVTGWKTGKAIPQESNLKRICEIFDVDTHYFDPYDFDEYDMLFNTRAEALSYKLQQYAQKHGMNDDFYNRLIKMKNFLRLFPFHEAGYTPALSSNHCKDNCFPLQKFEFQDINGLRKMMNEQDIDFIVRIQKQMEQKLLSSFRMEKAEIRKKRINNLIQWNLDHYDLDRDEVIDTLYAADFTDCEQELTEEKVNSVFQRLAEKHNIKPHIKKSEIYDRYFGNAFEEVARKYFTSYGYTEQEILESISNLEGDTDLIYGEIESYIRKGFVIDEDVKE